MALHDATNTHLQRYVSESDAEPLHRLSAGGAPVPPPAATKSADTSAEIRESAYESGRRPSLLLGVCATQRHQHSGRTQVNGTAPFRLPSCRYQQDGQERRAGFELEFSGMTLAAAIEAVAQALGAQVQSRSAAEAALSVEGLGVFNVELDWALLKQRAHQADPGLESELVERVAQLAERVVPLEVVCPPIPVSQLDCLHPMTAALRAAGAQGTEDSLIAAYGVHINVSAPALDADTLWRYLRAYALLQWWLVEAHAVDIARRVSPYVDLYPEAYVNALCADAPASVSALMDEYLKHNPTRNRALDMLPLFSVIDAERVQQVVEDARVKARPAFHYRLPNCHIDRPEWSLAQSWSRWCVIDELAQQAAALDTLAAQFLAANRGLLGVSREQWTQTVAQWLSDHALV